MSKTEIAKRYVLLIISLFFSGLGVAVTKHGELGVSPISSVANVLSCKFTAISLGNWLIIWNCILIVGQVIILRKSFKLIQLLQIPISFLFGYFTDFGSWLASFIPAESYAVRLVMVVLGVIILGFGVSLSVIANVVMNSGEAFVKAISDTIHKNFGNVKICFDISCVVAAILLSFLFFGFELVGTREGTIIAAVFTGVVVKFFTRFISKPIDTLLTGNK
ncbi:MAG: DUF6198 family protein [Ruminococcus sp.]|nr:DUF6198 family protein [Ruminococcus sp.]